VADWPTEVERVAEFLRRHAAEARIEEFTEGTPTAVEAARAVGCKLGQIVKSVVLACDARWVVALVPGDRRADIDKIAQAAGCERARIASPDEVLAATGFAAGAVAPFPLARIDRVYADRSLLGHKRLWIGAGSPNHLAAIAPTDLMRLSRAEPMDAVEVAP
jgi:prolyl-tRNA editing enzyme YbaK/EbsC (Cys-tRNA(Pro) deacylase)